MPTDALEIALDDALRRRLTSLPRLRWRLDRVGAQGRPGVCRLRTLIKDRDPKSLPESALETRFLRMLLARGFAKPSVQHVVTDGHGFIARVDFAFPESRVAIEVDGYRHHSGKAQWERDRARRNRLEAAGWRVIHATSEQMRRRPDEVFVPLAALLPEQLTVFEVPR